MKSSSSDANFLDLNLDCKRQLVAYGLAFGLACTILEETTNIRAKEWVNKITGKVDLLVLEMSGETLNEAIQCILDRRDFETVALGPCCACGKEDSTVRNLISFPKHAPLPGTGWGCVVCNLPEDGALAVVCDQCMNAGCPNIKDIIYGSPGSKERISIHSLSDEPFKHNWEAHAALEATK